MTILFYSRFAGNLVIPMERKHPHCLAPFAVLSLICSINGALMITTKPSSEVSLEKVVLVNPERAVTSPSTTLCGLGQLVTSLSGLENRKTYLITSSKDVGTTKMMGTATYKYGRAGITANILKSGLLVRATGYDQLELRNVDSGNSGYVECGLQCRQSNDDFLCMDDDFNLLSESIFNTSASSYGDTKPSLNNKDYWDISFRSNGSAKIDNHYYKSYDSSYNNPICYDNTETTNVGFTGFTTGLCYLWRAMTYTTGSQAWADYINNSLANVCASSTGNVAPSSELLAAWKAQADEYNAYPSSFRNYLSTYAVTTGETDTVSAAILKYQFILNKYGAAAFADYGGNFLNRAVASTSANKNAFLSSAGGEGTLVVLAVFGVLAGCGFVLLKKHRTAHGA